MIFSKRTSILTTGSALIAVVVFFSQQLFAEGRSTYPYAPDDPRILRAIGKTKPVTTPDMSLDEQIAAYCKVWTAHEEKIDASALPDAEKSRMKFHNWWGRVGYFSYRAMPCAPVIIRDFFGWNDEDISSSRVEPRTPELKAEVNRLMKIRPYPIQFPIEKGQEPTYDPPPRRTPVSREKRPCTADELELIQSGDSYRQATIRKLLIVCNPELPPERRKCMPSELQYLEKFQADDSHYQTIKKNCDPSLSMAEAGTDTSENQESDSVTDAVPLVDPEAPPKQPAPTQDQNPTPAPTTQEKPPEASSNRIPVMIGIIALVAVGAILALRKRG